MPTAPAADSTKDQIEQRVKEALRQQLTKRVKEVAPVVEAAPEPEVEKEVVAASNQVLFSTLIPGGKKTLRTLKLHDFGVTRLDIATLPTQVAGFVPKNKPTYRIQVAEAHALLQAWEMGEKVLITGPTGSGKSSLVEYCCHLTNRPFLRINMTKDAESAVLFGSLTVESGSTVWKDGPVTEGVRYGAVVNIDEWDLTPAEILMGMQWLLEEEGKLYLKEMPGESNDKFITPHANHLLVCSGNTVGQGDDTGRYAGTEVQNTATIDRFQTTIVLDYLDPAHETAIIEGSVAALPAGLATKMVSFAALVRTSCQQCNINLTMSPRTLINWGKKIVIYNNVKRALMLAFNNKLRESDRKIVEEFYTKVFGK
jgi:MoxR-like ATPase